MIRTLIALFMLSTLPANAVSNGRDFSTLCKQDEAACVMYIAGILSGYMFGTIDTTAKLDPIKFGKGYEEVQKLSGICKPKEVGRAQTKDVVLHYITNNPAIQHKSVPHLTLAALKQAYPCE